MTKWEYLFLTAQWCDGWRISSINGRDIAEWKRAPTMYEEIVTLGNQGWEMVTMQYFASFNQFGNVPSEEYEFTRITFKRVKESGQG